MLAWIFRVAVAISVVRKGAIQMRASGCDSASDGGGTNSTSRAIDILRSRGIKLVAFDMDQTAVATHSRGRLRRDNLQKYLEKATPDFLSIVPELHREDFNLAIATHSDEAEFGGMVKPETHILGKELATALIEKYFSPELASSFFIVAYNPRVQPNGHETNNKIKRFHMRELCKHFGVEPNQIVFFDDTRPVVRDCVETCGVLALPVDPKNGFQITDLLSGLSTCDE